ncbi:MAG: tetratricopeptide repeat protein, partial [Verrucomicrobia bacterium]|nr:tetratricopeptide repeat protein [Verrucomicrobiota bacterium]
NYNKGLTYFRQEQFAESIIEFTKAIEDDPAYFEAWKNMGIAHAKMEKNEWAAEAMRRAFEIKPRDVDTAVYLVKYLKRIGQGGKAVDIYRQAYEAGAKSPFIYKTLANDASENKDYKQAAHFYALYAPFRPSGAIYYNMGLAYRRSDQFEAAMEAYKMAVKIQSDLHKAWLNLGYLYRYKGEEEVALEHFEKALEIEPGYDNAIAAIEESATLEYSSSN